MNNYLIFELEENYCIPFREFYLEENKKAAENSYAINWSYLYFITKSPKYRFTKQAKKNTDSILVTIKRLDNNHIFDLTIMADSFLGIPEVLKWIEKYNPEKAESFKHETPGVWFDIADIQPTYITFYIWIMDLQFSINVGIEKMLLGAQETSAFFEEVKFPEILYIGKTTKKTKRFLKHEKLQMAVGLCNDYEEIYIWPTLFRTELFIYKSSPKRHLFEANNGDLDRDVNKVSLLESILIQFFQPELNSLSKKTDFTKNKLLHHFRNNGTDVVGFNWATHERFAHLSCKNQRILDTTRAFIHFDLYETGFSKKPVHITPDGASYLDLPASEDEPQKHLKDFIEIQNKKLRFW